jgi:hypothetical protein
MTQLGNGQEVAYLGDTPIDAPTILDGVISEAEYLTSQTYEVDDANHVFGASYEVTEYYAYDSEYFYYAFTANMGEARPTVNFQFTGYDSRNLTAEQIDLGIYLPARAAVRLAMNEAGDGVNKASDWWYLYEASEQIFFVWDENVFANAKVDDNGLHTYEFQIALDAIAETFSTYDYGMPTQDIITNLGLVLFLDSTQYCWYPASEAVFVIQDAGAVTYFNWLYNYVVFEEEPEPAPTTTPAPTTAAPTTAGATTAAATTAAEDDGGCGSSLAHSTLAIVPALGCGVVIAGKKRKYDE